MAREPRLHGFADAVEVTQLEAEQAIRQLVLLDHHEAIGLHHVGRHFGNESVGADAD